MKKKRYFMDRDNDGHWYLVDAEYRAEWEAWLDLGRGIADSWVPSLFAIELAGGPPNVTFSDPEETI